MKITTEGGHVIDTQQMPDNIEPFFCSTCGERLGWFNTSSGDAPEMWCDDCAAQVEFR